jgi:formiminotetrahydrofolate cyclodeaminase
VSGEFADLALAEVMQRVASAEPTPGAGPSLAWTCALAAGLVEMVSAVSLRRQPADPGVIERRRDRAEALRETALSLADTDAAAYRSVLAIQRRRDEAGHAARLRDALRAAADPLLAIAEAAAEVTRLAADAAADARGGVRGEALTAATLGAAVVRAGAPLVELNLAGVSQDPRLARVRHLGELAEADRARATGSDPG